MPTELFKLLGSEEAVVSSLGNMTQGIGFPLRPVETFSPLNIVTIESLRAISIIDQLPTGLGVELQITFGTPQTTEFWDLDAAGAMTCLVGDEYQLSVRFSIGRRGSAGGTAQIYVRLLVDGVQEGASAHVILDSPDFEIPASFTLARSFLVDEVLTFEVIRDTDGVDEGGLLAGNPDVVGWNDSPSASISITRTSVTTAANP